MKLFSMIGTFWHFSVINLQPKRLWLWHSECQHSYQWCWDWRSIWYGLDALLTGAVRCFCHTTGWRTLISVSMLQVARSTREVGGSLAAMHGNSTWGDPLGRYSAVERRSPAFLCHNFSRIPVEGRLSIAWWQCVIQCVLFWMSWNLQSRLCLIETLFSLQHHQLQQRAAPRSGHQVWVMVVTSGEQS